MTRTPQQQQSRAEEGVKDTYNTNTFGCTPLILAWLSVRPSKGHQRNQRATKRSLGRSTQFSSFGLSLDQTARLFSVMQNGACIGCCLLLLLLLLCAIIEREAIDRSKRRGFGYNQNSNLAERRRRKDFSVMIRRLWLAFRIGIPSVRRISTRIHADDGIFALFGASFFQTFPSPSRLEEGLPTVGCRFHCQSQFLFHNKQTQQNLINPHSSIILYEHRQQVCATASEEISGQWSQQQL